MIKFDYIYPILMEMNHKINFNQRHRKGKR